jgi:hypothetical protein
LTARSGDWRGLGLWRTSRYVCWMGTAPSLAGRGAPGAQPARLGATHRCSSSTHHPSWMTCDKSIALSRGGRQHTSTTSSKGNSVAAVLTKREGRRFPILQMTTLAPIAVPPASEYSPP